MVRDIITDEAELTQPSEPATIDDAPIVDDIIDSLRANEEAACLAANQIGEKKAIIVYLNDADKPVVMFNPKITAKLKPFESVESCLSKENPTAVVRYDYIRVNYEVPVDGKLEPRKKKLEGWSAQLVQHMIDHINGVWV